MENQVTSLYRLGDDSSSEYYGNGSFMKYCRDKNNRVEYIYLRKIISKVFL